ncbi:MAG: hypothetical protein ACLGIG_07285 [Actinomycetes bacterium]
MDVVEGVTGVLALLVVTTSVALTAVVLRRVLAPGSSGASARLVELLIAHAAALVVALVLGTFGVLGRTGLLATWGPVGAVAAMALLRRRPASAVDDAAPSEPRWLRFVAGAAVIVVAVQWLSVVPATSRTGVLAVDALHYHLPLASRFATTGSTTGLHRLSVPDAPTWYPAGDELLQATAMALLGTDVLVLGWGMVAFIGTLLAAAVLGRAWGSPSLVVLAACVLLATTGSAVGEANDWAATWPLMAAIAVLAQHQALRRWAVPVVVGTATGLAAGSKLTVLPAAVVVAVAAVVLLRPRALTAVLVGSTALATGGYWYVRNLLATGSPLPLLRLEVGPVALPRPPMPELDALSASVVSYATDADVAREWFAPGLELALGPAWPLLLVTVAVGIGVGVLSGSVRRPAAAVAATSVAAWLAGPTSAGGLPGAPYLFTYNVRYAVAGLLLGLALAVTAPGVVRRAPAAAAGATTLLLVSALARPGAWPQGVAPTAVAAVGATCCAVALTAAPSASALLARVQPAWRTTAAGAAATAVVAVAVMGQDRWLDRRYRGDDDARLRLFAAVQDLPSDATGVVGFPLLHPFSGPRLQRPVRYLGVLERDGHFRDARTCSELVSAAEDVDLVAVLKQHPTSPEPPAAEWLREADGVSTVYSGGAGSVFRIGARPECRS